MAEFSIAVFLLSDVNGLGQREKAMQRVLFGLAVSMMHISMMVKVLLGVAIHLYTVYIAYKVSGLLSAIVTLVLPVLAEMFWIVKILLNTGYFWSYLTIACAIYIGIWVLFSIFAGIAAASEPR